MFRERAQLCEPPEDLQSRMACTQALSDRCGAVVSPHESASATERINVTAPWRTWKVDVDLGRANFPEEDVSLHLDKVTVGSRDIRARAITERLFRRVVAKLFRAGVLDTSGHIVNTGSWIGDNAVPWALMLQQLRPGNAGIVFAVDPSAKNIAYTYRLAAANNVRNLCMRVATFSASNATHHYHGDEMHLSIEQGRSPRRGGGVDVRSVPLDSLGLQHVALLHLDVEGHEAAVLQGAGNLLTTSRPLVVTEGLQANLRGDPADHADAPVAAVLRQHGYIGDVIPEVCGWNRRCRNWLWWPDAKMRAAGMAVVGKDITRPLVDWVSPELTVELVEH